ncbi:Fic family protein [Desulfovibrio sp. JC022]|uniref:Fic family protein n=1 Tax=Desulfovibrio sp. JC022 TaxID=2593642 RepID=UPI0013D24B73|nr:Fic family protein [Desulfovibrio sp. JC022]NDV23936.1 Fic family protein [Desulfovibrio sp. JC022]
MTADYLKSESLTALLGEIDERKAQLDACRDTVSSQIVDALNIEYTYDSNRIEGNTLTLRETDLVINKGLTIGGKSMQEHLEAVNHYEAIQYVRELSAESIFSEKVIKDIHGIILQGIDRENAGRYRSVPVAISGSRHIPPQPWQVPILMEQLVAWYDKNEPVLHPVVLAAEVHERIATIHPFIDGNGRTARLVMNLILMQRGYLVVNIAGDTDSRLAYYGALEKCNLEDEKGDFIELIAGYVLKSLCGVLERVK